MCSPFVTWETFTWHVQSVCDMRDIHLICAVHLWHERHSLDMCSPFVTWETFTWYVQPICDMRDIHLTCAVCDMRDIYLICAVCLWHERHSLDMCSPFVTWETFTPKMIYVVHTSTSQDFFFLFCFCSCSLCLLLLTYIDHLPIHLYTALFNKDWRRLQIGWSRGSSVWTFHFLLIHCLIKYLCIVLMCFLFEASITIFRDRYIPSYYNK